jgi:hypothetical protein
MRGIASKLARRDLVAIATCSIAFACAPRASPPSAVATYEDRCTDDGMKEQECPLPDGRHGWCARECDDICGPDATYTQMSTSCVKPCGAGCNSCNPRLGFCVDDGPYGSEATPR